MIEKRTLYVFFACMTVTMAGCGAQALGVAPPPQENVRYAASDCAAETRTGYARCDILIRTDLPRNAPAGHIVYANQPFNQGSAPYGYHPSDLQLAYNLPSGGGGGQTVAVVDAYDDPNAESDLAVYRAQFGLPPCTGANGCFRKVAQDGGGYPKSDPGWSQEISLDLDVVSAVCPGCRIVLVEANSNNLGDLAKANAAAAALGVTAISNSFGAPEWAGEAALEPDYAAPGVAVTASTGDRGFGVEYPAASQHVTAVGGTTLRRSLLPGSRPFVETVWSGTGSGCSAYIAKPAWQPDIGCNGMRGVADVAFDADPATGIAMYDTYCGSSGCGWADAGGTSVSAPAVAALYALAGNVASVTPGRSYASAGALFNVTVGSNGNCGSRLCTAAAGYNGPTGNGTPNGIGAF
jgi:subtilase family serine protease